MNNYSHKEMGFLYFEQGQIDKAIGEFSQALESDFRNENANFGLGLCYHRVREFDKAIEAFNKVLKINPKHKQISYHLGLCYYQKKCFAEAIGYFKNSIRINPQYLLCSHEGLAQIYLEQNKTDLCLKELKQIKDLGQQDNPYHYIMAQIYIREKKYELAIEEFNQVLKINPQYSQVKYQLESCYIELGRIYFGNKDYSEAIIRFKKALELNSQSIDSYDGIAFCYFEQGLACFFKKQYDLTREAFNKAIEINTQLINMHQNLGVQHLERGAHDLAEKEFKVVLQCYSSNVFIYQKLGYIHKNQGKHEFAVADFVKATELYLTRENASKKFIDSCKKKTIGSINNSKFAAKILSLPSFCDKDEIRSTELNASLLPPLALGQITAHLRANGINIDQDDLNIKIHHDNYYSNAPDKEIDIAIFLDENRILRYISGANDNELELVMKKVEEKSNFSNYNIILFSMPLVFRNLGCLMFTLSLARFLKKTYNPILILGGINQSVDLLKKYDCKDMDFIIYREGEVMLFELLSALRNNTKLTEFLSSKVIENGKIIATESHPPIKPDFYGLPVDMYRYKGLNTSYNGTSRKILQEFNESGTLLLPFKFIKGCLYECIFCASSVGKSIYVLKPAVVALYLKELQEKYNPAGFFFLSDTINISKRYINELCDEILKNNIKIFWSDCARADNLDKDTILKMRAAGCIRLIFGMETASPKLLKYVNKKIGLKGLENALQWSDEAGIWTGVEIICGLPHEEDSDIEKTAIFLNRNKEHINSLYFNQFNLKEGSLLLEHPKTFGIENIIEINQYANKDKEFDDFNRYSYDEINGLKWRYKKRQIADSYKRLLGNTYWTNYFPAYEYEHFLFFLYNKFSDKQKISDIFNKASLEKDNLFRKLVLNNKKMQLV